MKALRHAGIVVKDLAKALYFYRDLLGLKIVKQADETGEFIDKISGLQNVKVTTVKMATDNGNLLELLYYHTHPRKSMGKQDICELGVSHVAFTVEDIEGLYGKLLNERIEFNTRPQVSADGGAKVTFCRDYENNLVELVEELK